MVVPASIFFLHVFLFNVFLNTLQMQMDSDICIEYKILKFNPCTKLYVTVNPWGFETLDLLI